MADQNQNQNPGQQGGQPQQPGQPGQQDQQDEQRRQQGGGRQPERRDDEGREQR
ncbi:hypothetical protein [Sphingobium lactosutens]|uniref:hypothetical protein n=1 Tax=Sphingobium lactosutens TaxID=522773 RepID=UPI0015BAAB58|nr:hypothetical protein [Sphingobium lactosutens]